MYETFSEIENFFLERRKIGIKLGLDRVLRLFNLLGNPQRNVDAIHVAGTNGKGSTIQFLQNSLLASGHQIGVFTSPSFTGLTGHFVINGQEISESATVNLFNNIVPAIINMDEDDNHPTEYEILTVMAFVYFNKHVDIALIETAMGGKEDTTNCFIPILSIITNVAMDHVDYLGNTIEEITDHKAGIIKSNRPVVVGEVSDKSEAIIHKIAQNLHAPTHFFNRDYTIDLEKKIVSSGSHSFNLSLAMQGDHQLKNASLVLEALLILAQNGYHIDWSKSIEAVNNTTLYGRFEMISQQPIIILDSAHNQAGVEAFVKTVAEQYFSRNKEVIFSAFADKQFDTMINELENNFTHIFLTTFKHPRAVTFRQLSSVSKKDNVLYLDNWHQQITDILASKNDTVYFVTGSMHFIILVRNYIIDKLQHDQ